MSNAGLTAESHRNDVRSGTRLPRVISDSGCWTVGGPDLAQLVRTGQDDTPITAATGLRSSVENRWRDAARAAGKRADLEDIRAIDPDLVERESWLLGSALRQVVAGLPQGGRALVAGPRPTSEAALPRLAGPGV